MIDIRQILCPIDFSEASRHALNLASSIAHWYGARLEILSVFPTVGVMDVPPRELDVATRDRIIADARRFGAQTPSDVAVDVKVTAAAESDREIVTEARQLPADLLVMGTHGRSGFRRMFLGSVTERVLRDPPCAVLVAPPLAADRDPAAPARFHEIVCAVDFSPGSQAALRYALALAQESEAHLLVLNVIEVPPELVDHPPAGPADVDGIRAAAEAERRRCLRELRPPESKVFCTIETAVADGAADRAILLACSARNADLLVLGVNHHSTLDRLVFGSVAAGVTRSAPCPVLLVPGHQAH